MLEEGSHQQGTLPEPFYCSSSNSNTELARDYSSTLSQGQPLLPYKCGRRKD